jgi:hypothetical protein
MINQVITSIVTAPSMPDIKPTPVDPFRPEPGFIEELPK